MSMREALHEGMADYLSSAQQSCLLGFDVSRHRISSTSTRQVIDLPICEETIVGMAVGLSRCGVTVLVDLMFEAFLFRAFDVLANQVLSAWRLHGREQAPLLIKVTSGPFEGAGPQHSALAGEVVRALEGWTVATPVCASDVRACFAEAARGQRPHLLLMPTEEALDHAVYHGSVPHSVRATKRCGRTAIVAPARLYSLSSEVLADGGNDDGIALVSIPFVQPFPWSALADLCAGFDQVVWLQIGGSHSQEAIRAAYLQQLCGRPVREALVCREGVGAFTRERCKAEIRAAIGINREAQHGDGLFERGSI